MFKNEREQEIMKVLDENDYVTVRALSDILYTSESSIRRDLSELEKKGFVKRSYGGVEKAKSSAKIIPFSTRVHHNIREKKTIAKKAVSLISDGDIIFLDQSSSSIFVAKEIVSRKKLTVVTNNTEILSILADSSCIVYSSGGRLSNTNKTCLIGEDAHGIFNNIHADWLFFSAQSVTSDGIIYDCTREEVNIRNTMMNNSAKNVFLCDSEKFDAFSGYRQCSLAEVDYLISETDCREKFKAFSDTLKILC